MKQGEFFQARLKIRRFVNGPDPDGQIAALLAAMEWPKRIVASKNAEARSPFKQAAAHLVEEHYPDPAADYVERVQTYWLPQAEHLPATAPASGPEYGSLLSELEGLRSYVSDGEALSLNNKQRSVALRFKQVLAAKQAALYPSFRKNYADGLRTGLFRDDVDVVATGPRASTLRLTGSVFVRNANIEDMQQSLSSALEKMRFKAVEYRWSRYIGDGYRYEMHPKPDSDLSQ
jgi:hypothetical protein